MHDPQLLALTIIPTDHSSQICGHSSPEWLWSLHLHVLGNALLWGQSGVAVMVGSLYGVAWSSWDCKTLCHFWGSGSHPFGALFLNIRETYRKTSVWFSSILAHFRSRRQWKGWGERLPLCPSNEEHDSWDAHLKNGRSDDWQMISQPWLWLFNAMWTSWEACMASIQRTICKPLAFPICSMHGK